MTKFNKVFEGRVFWIFQGSKHTYTLETTLSLPINVSGDCENYSNQSSILSCKIHPFKITLPHQKVRNQTQKWYLLSHLNLCFLLTQFGPVKKHLLFLLKRTKVRNEKYRYLNHQISILIKMSALVIVNIMYITVTWLLLQ